MITQQMARYLIEKAKLIYETPNIEATNRTEETMLSFWNRHKVELPITAP